MTIAKSVQIQKESDIDKLAWGIAKAEAGIIDVRNLKPTRLLELQRSAESIRRKLLKESKGNRK